MRPRKRSRLSAVILLFLQVAIRSQVRAQDANSATTKLRAKWLGAPIVHEAAEFLVRNSIQDTRFALCIGLDKLTASSFEQAEEDEVLFWRFAEAWLPDVSSDGSCWQQVLQSASRLITSATAQVLLQCMHTMHP